MKLDNNKGFTFYGLAIGTVLFGTIYAIILTLFVTAYSYYKNGIPASGELLLSIVAFAFLLASIVMVAIHLIMKNNPGR